MKSISEPTLAVAETDAVVRDSVIQALQDEFKLVVAAHRGSGKVALFAQAELMIYDLKLGIRDLKNIRERYPEMPIVLIAPKAPEPTSTLNEALQLDKTDFVTKPVDGKELKIRVNRCLRRWQADGLTRQAEGPLTTSSIQVPMPELHSRSGRLNAAMIAKSLDVPLSDVAAALKVNYTALHKTPDSMAVQSTLRLFKRIHVILMEMLGDQKTVRAWLNSPHVNLGQRSPISVMLEGHADAVLTILENALAGVPS